MKSIKRLTWILGFVPGYLFAPTSQVDLASYRQPGEFERQDTVWMSATPDDPEFLRVTADILKALDKHVSIRLVLNDEKQLQSATKQLNALGVDVKSIQISVDPYATLFMRDSAVFLKSPEGKLGVLDLKWSTYGMASWCTRTYGPNTKGEAECLGYQDEKMDACDQSIAKTLGVPIASSPLLLENATFEVNGRGVLLISESLAKLRYPGYPRDHVEKELRRLPGVKKVIWLGHGLAEDPHMVATITWPFLGMGAGGHTDEFVRFVDAKTIALAWVDSDRAKLHPVLGMNRERMFANYTILSKATDQDGKPFRIVKVPMPNVVQKDAVIAPETDQSNAPNIVYFRREGRKVGSKVKMLAAASYLNFLIANDVVLVPSFVADGTPKALEAQVKKSFQVMFPGRQVKMVRTTPFTWNGGGLHCATLSQPK